MSQACFHSAGFPHPNQISREEFFCKLCLLTSIFMSESRAAHPTFATARCVVACFSVELHRIPKNAGSEEPECRLLAGADLANILNIAAVRSSADNLPCVRHGVGMMASCCQDQHDQLYCCLQAMLSAHGNPKQHIFILVRGFVLPPATLRNLCRFRRSTWRKRSTE